MNAELNAQSVTLRYFAWVRERTRVGEEHVTLPAGIATVRDLLIWQASRGSPFASAFANPKAIRVALDHRHAGPDAEIEGVREIAFFPPVTGG